MAILKNNNSSWPLLIKNSFNFDPVSIQAAERILNKYLTREFMSTRIGIRREGSVLSAVERTGSDGRKYYDLAIRMTSYGSVRGAQGVGRCGMVSGSAATLPSA